MIQAKLVNKYHTISLKDGKWCFQGHYSDYDAALQAAKSWTKHHPDTGLELIRPIGDQNVPWILTHQRSDQNGDTNE